MQEGKRKKKREKRKVKRKKYNIYPNGVLVRKEKKMKCSRRWLKKKKKMHE